VGDDVTCDVAARSLAAAGVGTTRFVRRAGEPSDVLLRAMTGSNPDARTETRAWPTDGAGWVVALTGATAIVRSGFDDDAMLRAAVRLGVPAVVTRATVDGVDVMSFRRHGPCPHAALEVPGVSATTVPSDGAAAVIAGQLAAAEVLMLLVGEGVATPRARHLRLPLDGSAPRTTVIPWTPECIVCGGSAAMTITT